MPKYTASKTTKRKTSTAKRKTENTKSALGQKGKGTLQADKERAELQRQQQMAQSGVVPGAQNNMGSAGKDDKSGDASSGNTSTTTSNQTADPKTDDTTSYTGATSTSTTTQDVTYEVAVDPDKEPVIDSGGVTSQAGADVGAAGYYDPPKQPETQVTTTQENAGDTSILDDPKTTEEIVEDEIKNNLAIAEEEIIGSLPNNNNNPTVKSNQYTEGDEFVDALGKPYIGFYHVLQDMVTMLQGRGRIGEFPTIEPSLLIYPYENIITAEPVVEEPEVINPDAGLTIPAGFPVGVGATHMATGQQFYSCPPSVPIDHPIVQRCVKIDKNITSKLI